MNKYNLPRLRHARAVFEVEQEITFNKVSGLEVHIEEIRKQLEERLNQDVDFVGLESLKE